MTKLKLYLRSLLTGFLSVKPSISKLSLLAGLLLAGSVNAATYYVDSAATGANTGASWADAWTSIGAIGGVHGGDTVYISGGPSGSARTYSLSTTWVPAGGASGSIVTYQIGQDSAHNGTAIFDCRNSSTWVSTSKYVTVSGDAGDGQMHFSLINCSYAAYVVNCVNMTISYVNMGQITCGNGNGSGAVEVSGGSGFQLDHCYCVIWDTIADRFSYGLFAGGAFDVNKAFNNTIFLPRSVSGSGSDGFQWNGSGFSLYNNTVVGYTTNYSGGQHQDGFQATSGSYIKVYNNTWRNLANSCVFLDAYWGDFSHCWIYNNLVELTDPAMVNPGYNQEGLTAGPDGGVLGNLGRYPVFTDVIICNNTLIDIYNIGAIAFRSPSDSSATWVNCVCENNVAVNTPGFWVDPPITTAHNVLFTSANVGNNFVYYLPYNANDDLHLTASATSLIGTGANLSSYFTTDMAGNPRPATGNWDIGCYLSGTTSGSTNTPPPPSTNTYLPPVVSSIAQNATDLDPTSPGVHIYEGTVVTFSGTASSPVGKSLTWQWMYTVNGGSSVIFQSGSGTVLPVSYTFGLGTAGSSYLWTLQVSDGTSTVTSPSQLMVVEAAPVVSQGLSFAATAGVITAPMATNSGGYISQPVQTTTVSSAGTATYNFTITNAGSYVVQTMVNAPGDAANSFYVNIDSTPVDPTMIWDIPITSGFEQRLISWRGNGTDTANQFVPEVFNLTAGNHQLIIGGREAGVQLQSLSLLKVPQPPQGLRVVAAP